MQPHICLYEFNLVGLVMCPRSSSASNLKDVANPTSIRAPEPPQFTMRITSWGYRHGPLLPAPLVSIDLRKLPIPPKRARGKHTGTSQTNRDWLFSNDVVRRRFEYACVEIRRVLVRAAQVGHQTVTIGVNCELGRHRSVAFVEELGRMKWDGWETVVEHRDLTTSGLKEG
jgi:RNase adaptor protein for sRNA GlmZ degradation